MNKTIKDLTGKRFERLIVLNITDKRNSGNVIWKCRCDCGNVTYVISGHLVSGNTKSCGCLRNQIKGKNNPNWKGGETKKICKVCGREFYRRPSGIKQGGGKYCSNKCKGMARMGKNCPRWMGGISFEPYEIEFNRKRKREIRKRDNYICQNCSKTQKENGRKLEVHHIDYDKKNNEKSNLIALCRSCHSRANGERKYWEKFYKEKVSKRRAFAKMESRTRNFALQ